MAKTSKSGTAMKLQPGDAGVTFRTDGSMELILPSPESVGYLVEQYGPSYFVSAIAFLFSDHCIDLRKTLFGRIESLMDSPHMVQ